ncbi:Glutaredoxin [Alkalispirochaeta americana]|uniref:Glutaredoxin n=1 Tax=Alkalispirochaeta americana TaxID=159291 RepID=A0A1N6VPN0_9SPIO|nr:glutaredoxin [Alkalispirochaeta americana]SIQ79832.1 Glutaredoxin [Alkalispirochaeta americana]
MEKAIDSLTFETVDGPLRDHEVTVFSLSTCAFCHKAIDFLTTSGVQFQYIHLDLIDQSTKRAVKRELSDRFDNVVVFPILVVDHQRAFSGFTESVWTRALDL